MMKDVVIFGTGGHAKVVHDIILKQGKYRTVAFFSLDKTQQSFLGLPHFHQNEFKKSHFELGVVAIGDNWVRSKVVEFILGEKPEFNFINAVHSSAQIGEGVSLGVGNVVMANAVINPGSKVESHVIVNTSSSVDHDCYLGSFSSIAPGAVLGGRVRVGDFSAISLGAKIIHNKNIGPHAVIGAGALVLNDVPEKSVSYGVPCRFIKKRSPGEKYL